LLHIMGAKPRLLMKYDYLIVGSGLFGAVFAHEMTKNGKRCLVVEKRHHIGGNTFCRNWEGINIHEYGPHIFHTNDTAIWNYVNSFVEFNSFTYMPVAKYKDELFNLPFNMNTFYQLWKVTKPEEAISKIKEQVKLANITSVSNLEEQAISLVGTDIYEKLIKGYTEKQWGRKCSELPSFIIKRLPVRFTYDNNYFDDRYQGIPIGGYNKLLEGMLDGIEVKLNTDFIANRYELSNLADKIVFTGPIDEYFDYKFGSLEYRSLRFEHELLQQENYQGCAAVNYTSADVPYTRIIEHKHFEFGKQAVTAITREYPQEWKKGSEPFYPINDERNSMLHKQYKTLADAETNVIFGGRLAEYRYYDMHQVIAAALKTTKVILSNA